MWYIVLYPVYVQHIKRTFCLVSNVLEMGLLINYSHVIYWSNLFVDTLIKISALCFVACFSYRLVTSHVYMYKVYRSLTSSCSEHPHGGEHKTIFVKLLEETIFNNNIWTIITYSFLWLTILLNCHWKVTAHITMW